MALTDTSKHTKWIANLCDQLGDNQLGFKIDFRIIIDTDSKGVKGYHTNPVFHKRTKHINIQHQVKEKFISITQVPTQIT
jgi:hypothetical protein